MNRDIEAGQNGELRISRASGDEPGRGGNRGQDHGISSASGDEPRAQHGDAWINEYFPRERG